MKDNQNFKPHPPPKQKKQKNKARTKLSCSERNKETASISSSTSPKWAKRFNPALAEDAITNYNTNLPVYLSRMGV